MGDLKRVAESKSDILNSPRHFRVTRVDRTKVPNGWLYVTVVTVHKRPVDGDEESGHAVSVTATTRFVSAKKRKKDDETDEVVVAEEEVEAPPKKAKRMPIPPNPTG